MPKKEYPNLRPELGREHPEWKKNQGRFGRLPPEELKEIQIRGGKAAAAKNAARREAEKKLVDKQGMLNEAVSAVMADDPEVLAKIMQNIAQKAQDPDDKAALAAADIFLKHSGITAPKQQEVVVEDNRSIEDTAKELEELGVNVTGLKVVK